MAEQRPTYEWVRAKLERRRSALSPLTTAMLEDEDYRMMASRARGAALPYLSGLPDGFVPSYPPMGQDATQAGVNRIVSGAELDVTVTFPDGAFDGHPVRNREAVERERRDLYTRWVRGACRRLSTKSAESVSREQSGQVLALGMGAVMYPLDYTAWPDPPFGWLPVEDGERRPAAPRRDTAGEREKLRSWERQRRRSYPWETSSPHPTWVFWDLDHAVPRDYIIEQMVSPSSVAESYPDLSERWAPSEEKTLTRITYVSEEWMGQWCDGEPLLRGKGVTEGVAANRSGRPWVQMAFSGMGNKDKDGSWEHRVKGSIRDGRDILLMMCKAFNWLAAMGEMTAFPPVMGTRRQLEQLEFGAGATIEVESNEQMPRAFEPPRTPEQVYRLWEIASERFAGHFGQPVLSGERSPGEPTGSLRSRASMAGMPFEAVKVSVEQAWSAMMEHKIEMIKTVLMEAVTVEGVTMRPGDVVEGAQIKLDLTPLTEEERAFKRTAAQDDVKLGAMTTEDYIRTERGIDDAVAVEQSVAVQRVRDLLLQDLDVIGLAKRKLVADLTAKLGIAPEAPPLAPGTGEPVGDGASPLQMQPPEPTVGSPGEAMQYVQSLNGAPPVTLPQRAVQVAR